MTILEAISYLDRAVDPHRGLPEELFLFISRMSPLVNVDLLIQDRNKGTLLTWRDDDFFGQGWHLPGGIIRYKERATERIEKCAENELGCAVHFDPKPLMTVENFAERRNRAHFISLLYRCELAGNPDPERRASDPAGAGQWKWHATCPDNLLPLQETYAALL
jgi:ADP-ribose pyrophosphatase YjhB (NUDIX family)